jgi:hypothetical protein
MISCNVKVQVIAFALGASTLVHANPPGFRVKWGRMGDTVTVASPSCPEGISVPGQYSYTMTPLNENGNCSAATEWELSFTNLRTNDPVIQIIFPYESSGAPLGESASDDVVFYPFQLGVAHKMGAFPSELLPEATYPGVCFSPLIIIADGALARMTAAINWPPKKVSPRWGVNTINMEYNTQGLQSGQQSTYRCMVHSDIPQSIYPPWTVAAEYYKTWLKDKIDANGLTPQYPPTMVYTHGLIDIQLESFSNELLDAGAVQQIWNSHGNPLTGKPLNWIQFWGQMGTGIGTVCGTACCVLDQNLCGRFADHGLNPSEFALGVQNEGGLVGFYHRPYFCNDGLLNAQLVELANQNALNSPLVCGSGPTERAFRWFTNWMETATTTWHANAYYLDTVGAGYWGDPLCIAKLLKGETGSGALWCLHPDDVSWYSTANYQFSEYSLIEKACDIYPSPMLMSACLHYPYNCACDPTCAIPAIGWPAREDPCSGNTFYTLNNVVDGSVDRVPFPQLGTYILSDRTNQGVTSSIIFNGEANTGYQVWGPANDYYAERQCFLLGHKFDAERPYLTFVPPYDSQDEAMYAAIDARDCIDWWAHRPQYRDRRGITVVDGSIDVRVFLDPVNSSSLFAVDNWAPLQQGEIRRFKFNNTWYYVTDPAKLQIIKENGTVCP